MIMQRTPHHPSYFMSPFPSNAGTVARINAKQAGQPKGLGAMDDYIDPLYWRSFDTQGDAGPGGERGPVSAPIIAAPEDESEIGLLRSIRDLLYNLPQAMSLEWRTRFIVRPRESISFLAPSPNVTIAAGAAVAVVRQTIQERFTGFLTDVGIAAFPDSALTDLTWQIRINGNIHPEFADRVFSANNLSTLHPFFFELTQARTLELVAINTGGAPIVTAGVLAGYTEYMSDYKPYGASPAAGIA